MFREVTPETSVAQETKYRDPSPSPQDDGPVVKANAPRFVQGLGLFSATAIVMGSMIGSGIFIVPAEMSRVVGSPALLIAAWAGDGSDDGDWRAELWRAGGDDAEGRRAVCLSARGLGPLWGFLYGWTLFLVIQTGTIAAVGVAFGKFLGVFFPSISQTNWIVAYWACAGDAGWADGAGQMDIGLNTANLARS